jgi:tetratricopeptide (TPR) repeat protein
MMNENKRQKKPAPEKSYPKWFYAVPILIPILFFITLELTLRAFNYGNDYTLFKSISSYYPDKLFINPDIARKYFSNLINIPAPVDDAFDKIKKNNAFRIFVLGGSSVEGFPFVANASFPRDLKRRLQLLYPNKDIEVINCGMSAINSYTVRDFVPSIIKEKPDLILIYMGHNEYYGALGVASSVSGGYSPWLTNLYIKLDNFRSFQLIINSIRWITGIFKNTHQPGGTLMERMVGKSLIPLNSKTFNLGVEQFKDNMTYILKSFKNAGVPVITGSLTCNLKDMKPFVSKKEKGFPAADDVYKEAQKKLSSGDIDDAKKLFLEAKELDELRFRAPKIFNTILRKLSLIYNDAFINIDSVFASKSKYGIVGSNLIVDHLHPNIEGYKLMAESFYLEMKNSKLLPKGLSKNLSEAEQDSTLNANFPFTKLDSAIGALTIDVITGTYPFVPKGIPNYKLMNFKKNNFIDSIAYDYISRKISLEDAHAKVAEWYFSKGNIKKFCSEVNDLIADKPYNIETYNYAARKLIKTKHFEDAIPYLTGLNKMKPSSFSSKWLGQIYLIKHDYSNALNYLGESLQFSNTDPKVWYNIAGAYYYNNKLDDALNAIKESLRLDPHNPRAISFYRQLLKIKQ